MKKYKCITKYGVEKIITIPKYSTILIHVDPPSNNDIKYFVRRFSRLINIKLIRIHAKNWGIRVLGNSVVISCLSALRNLPFLNVILRPLQQIFGGTIWIRNTAIGIIRTKNGKAKGSGNIRNTDNAISPTPNTIDNNVRFLSVVRNLDMSFLGKFIIDSISHNFSKILVLSIVLLIFNQDIYAKNAQNESNNACLREIEIYENKYNIPNGLLRAISHIESGHKPYALNDGEGSYIFNNKQDLIEKASRLIDRGHYNLDIGCMQLNYKWHGKYFNSIEEMVDIRSNVRYAAGFLYSLYKEYGSWQKAVRFYHSKNADYYKKYSRKVVIAWLYNR